MTDPSPQRDSPSYRLAIEDPDFLLRDELRALRFAMEYEKAELALRDWGVRSTVVVFGSARIPAPEDVVSGTPLAALAPWYDAAREFGRIVSLRGGALCEPGGQRDHVICTGGGPGIMAAANRGAADVGAPSIGLNISLPREQAPNPWSTPELTFRFHYFAMRKMHFAMRAKALAVFPGGFGTFDELFEILTLQQTRKGRPVCILLFGRRYWREVVDFAALRRHGLIDPADLALFDLVDDPEEGWHRLLAQGLLTQAPGDEAGSRR